MKRIAGLAIALALVLSPAVAFGSPAGDAHAELAAHEAEQDARITALEARVAALEARPAPTATPLPSATPSATPTAAPSAPAPPPVVPGTLPVGGDPSLRGAKPFTFQPPTATVAAPCGIAQVNAAKTTAGVNGVVRLPHACSPYAFGITLDVAGQRWQAEQPGTTIAGGLTVTAPDITWEGGQVNGEIFLPQSGQGHRFTFVNARRQGGNRGILNESRSGLVVRNAEFYGQSGGFIETYYEAPGSLNVDGLTVENTIMVRTVGSGVSAIVGHNAGGNDPAAKTIKNFRVTNTYIDSGTQAQGWFGIEVWNNTPNAAGKGGIVEYSDLRGGQVLISMVNRSTNNWIHHNRLDTSIAWGAYESAGPNHSGALLEYNLVVGRTPFSGGFVYHNSGSHHNTIRWNTAVNLHKFLWTGDAGGGYAITDNCLQNVQVFVEGTFAVPNTLARNGPCQ